MDSDQAGKLPGLAASLPPSDTTLIKGICGFTIKGNCAMEFRALSEFSCDVYSQFGEDGIIAEVLDRIEMVQPLTRWCVEFGAHDGVFMSNTCNLVRTHRFRAVMIESDPQRARELTRNHPQPEVIKITATVGFDGDNRLDRILASTPLPKEFDLLSIDIDGCDYWILDSIEDYRPAVIIIEFNPCIPNAVEFVQPRDIGVRQGSSANSLLRLAESKGYELVAATEANLIVVRSDLHDAVMGHEAEKIALEALRDDSSAITYAFAGFDGTLLFSSPEVSFPWHNVSVDTSRIQPIPKFWRTFRGNWKNLGLRFQTWKIFRRHTRRFLPPKIRSGFSDLGRHQGEPVVDPSHCIARDRRVLTRRVRNH